MSINFMGIILATIVQFAIGAIWYGPIFSRTWGKIHGFDKLPKAVQQKMIKEMGPFYVLQLLVTIITSFVLAVLQALQISIDLYLLTAMIWVGFVVPAQVSGVIFSGTDKKWITTKIAILAGGSLACLMAATLILNIFK